MTFKLVYRVLKEGQANIDGGFESSENIKKHVGRTVNPVIGMTGSGKTSMIQISAGGEETSVRTKSETQAPVLIFDEVNNKLWLDTAGMCDSSEDSNRKAQLRNAILDAIKQFKFTVGRIFVCVACDQNMDIKFAHEYVEFKEAIRGADSLTRVVITKVNRPKKAKQIQAEGGLKEKYASAFGCSEAQVLMHGWEPLDKDILNHAVSPSYKSGVNHEDIGQVTENAELKKRVQRLQDQLDRLESSKNSKLSGKQLAWEKTKRLFEVINDAENTLDHLISTNSCGRNNGAIRDAHSKIARARRDVEENQRKMMTDEISAAEASRACDKTHADILKAKEELEDRMRRGLGLSVLAGAGEIFKKWFDV